MSDLNDFESQLTVLGHVSEGYKFTEVRVKPVNGRMTQHFLNSPKEYSRFSSLFKKGFDVYVGIHQRDKKSGLAVDINELKTLVIDIDPVRPKGKGSTDKQHKASEDLARRIVSDYSKRYPDCYSYIVSSGSGSHVYFPIETIKVTNHKNLTRSLKHWTDLVKKVYSTKDLKIDSIFDLGRIIRVWGSYNNKSDRLCKLLSSQGSKPAKIVFDQSEKTYAITQTSTTPSVMSGLKRRFQLAVENNPVLASYMNKSASFESRSEADYAFIGTLLKSGFNTGEIKTLIRLNPLGRGQDIKEGDVDRVTEKFVNNGLKVHSASVYTDKYFGSLLNRKSGIPIGLKSIDEATGGLRSEVTIVSARPGNGKTSLMCQIAYNLASRGKRVLLFPTELSSQPIYDKIMAQISEVKLIKFRDGAFDKEDMDRLKKAKSIFSDLPLTVIEDFGLTMRHVLKCVEQIRPDVMMLDYIQSMKFREGGSPYELAQVMQQLTDIAGAHNIPVVVASQLSRPSDVSQINMSHLKGSGALEEKARVIQALITLDFYIDPRPVDMHILKNSYGETGKFPLTFHKNIGKFVEGRL